MERAEPAAARPAVHSSAARSSMTLGEICDICMSHVENEADEMLVAASIHLRRITRRS